MGDFFSFSLVPFLLFFVFSQLFFVGYSSRFLVQISNGLFFIFKIEPITILSWSCIVGPYFISEIDTTTFVFLTVSNLRLFDLWYLKGTQAELRLIKKSYLL